MNGLALGEEIWMFLPLRLFLSEVRHLVLYLDSSNMMATSILGKAVRQSHCIFRTCFSSFPILQSQGSGDSI